jgi:putative restriction endonuclease
LCWPPSTASIAPEIQLALFSWRTLFQKPSGNYRKVQASPREDYEIGNIVLEDPFFLPRQHWIPAPDDFAKSVVQGKSYDLAQPQGRALWGQVLAARALASHQIADRPVEVEGPMFGEGRRGRVRPHQGAFRVMVTDSSCCSCGLTCTPCSTAATSR